MSEIISKENSITENTTSKNKSQIVMKTISALCFIFSVVLCIFGYKKGLFTSQEKLQAFISKFGITGPLVFIAFQAVQVVFPLLPGAIGCLAGVILFGVWKGFAFNYIGICIGSIIAFLVSKHFGRPILQCFFSKKLIEKYDKWTSEKGRFTKMFTIAIFLPVAPDDFLCYLAGTTEMKLSRFITIILLGKPGAIALYSLGLAELFTFVTRSIF